MEPPRARWACAQGPPRTPVRGHQTKLLGCNFRSALTKRTRKSAFYGVKHLNELLVAGQGVLLRREERSLSVQLDYCLRTGSLVSTLPGIYTAPQPGWQARIRAADAFRAGCVITGAAAALITWWPECPITEVSVAVPTRCAGAIRASCGSSGRFIPT